MVQEMSELFNSLNGDEQESSALMRFTVTCVCVCVLVCVIFKAINAIPQLMMHNTFAPWK